MLRLSVLVVVFCLAGAAFFQPAAQETKTPSPPSKSRLTVAVTDLLARGVESSVAEIISERFRSELLNTGFFRVMERGQMDMVLKEQGFQQSGACTDEACLVEMGQIMGVERMVAGSMGKLGTLFTLSIRLINVESGEIMATVNEDCDCDVKILISQTVPALAKKMAQAAGFASAPAPSSSPVSPPKPAAAGFSKNTKLGLGLLGAGVVTGILAGVFLSGANSQYDTQYMSTDFDVSTPAYQDQLDERYSAYQSKMIITWICAGAAAATLPASTYFLLAKTPAKKAGPGL